MFWKKWVASANLEEGWTLCVGVRGRERMPVGRAWWASGEQWQCHQQEREWEVRPWEALEALFRENVNLKKSFKLEYEIIRFAFFFLRKISPELTTASPPLFAEEAWPWANIVPIFLYFICGTPTTAWCAKQCHVRTRDLNRRNPGHREGEHANLTAVPPGLPPHLHFL